jgi:sterol desaturase/sphingolipid hydroxylase (fatty acid hydroxylase superfamily)
MRDERNWIGLLVGFAILGAIFAFVETRFRSVNGPLFFRRADFRTDLAYWFFTPLVSRSVTGVAVGGALLAIVWASGGSVAELRESFRAGRTPDVGWTPTATWLRARSLPAQLLLGVLVSDFIAYWMHRAFHRGRLWGLHAVHHASPRLDWLSSVRLHPLNQALMTLVQSLPLLFIGFDPRVFAAVAPLFTFYAIAVHANVGWDFGPLRNWIASPRFHRWHHTSEQAGRDKNFAGLFPGWDRMFGTFYMPPDQVPTQFGAGSEPVPAGLWRQIAYPFRKPRRGERLAADLC